MGKDFQWTVGHTVVLTLVLTGFTFLMGCSVYQIAYSALIYPLIHLIMHWSRKA